MKGPLPTLRVVKEAFADSEIATFAPDAPAVTVDAREGPLPPAQPRKLDLHVPQEKWPHPSYDARGL